MFDTTWHLQHACRKCAWIFFLYGLIKFDVSCWPPASLAEGPYPPKRATRQPGAPLPVFLPDAMASVFSSSWASFPIQTNTCRGKKRSLGSALRSEKSPPSQECSLPDPRCPGSWHHRWRDHPGSTPQEPLRSDERRRIEHRIYDTLLMDPLWYFPTESLV